MIFLGSDPRNNTSSLPQTFQFSWFYCYLPLVYPALYPAVQG